MDPQLLSVALAAIVGIVVRVVSNRRTIALESALDSEHEKHRAELGECRARVEKLESENHALRCLASRSGTMEAIDDDES